MNFQTEISLKRVWSFLFFCGFGRGRPQRMMPNLLKFYTVDLIWPYNRLASLLGVGASVWKFLDLPHADLIKIYILIQRRM